MADCYLGIEDAADIRKFVEKQGIDEAEIIIRANLKKKKANLQRTKTVQVKLFKAMDSHPEGQEVGLRAVLAQDLYGKATNSNVFYRQKALQGLAESKIVTIKQRLSTTKLGFSRDKQLGRDFIRAVLGDVEVSDVAKKMANEWTDASEWLRLRFNEHGGNLGKLQGGYLPQSHDRIAVQQVGKDEWVNFIQPLLKDNDLDLDFVYSTISTGGLNKIKEGGTTKGKAIVNKHADPRILHFKDADSWIKYQERFGNEDPLASIDDHIRGLTTDMSMIEIMGPNPLHMWETLKTKVDKSGGKNKEFRAYTDGLFDVVSAKVDTDLQSIGLLGTAAQTLRGVQTATLLGSATLSAISDLGSLFVNTAYHGLNPLKVAKSFVKNLNIKNQEDAFRAGLGVDVFNSEVTKRFSEVGEGFWAKASEALMRATFLNIWTEAARKSFQTEYMHKLLKGRATKDLSEPELIRMLEEVQEQTDYAVIVPTARTRVITTAGKEKGTGIGELVRTTTQFQSFTITFMQQHGARILMQGNLGSRLAYGSAILTVSTLLGAVSMMAKDAAKGFTARHGLNVFDEDVKTEDKAKFWGAAVLQGGGAGIFGDLLFSDQNRFGQKILPGVGGPTGGLIEDTVKLTIGNLQQAVAGEKTNIGSEAVNFVNRHANPVNTFYLKLLIDRYVARNLKIAFDKDFERKERRRLRKRKKEYKQEQFDWLN